MRLLTDTNTKQHLVKNASVRASIVSQGVKLPPEKMASHMGTLQFLSVPFQNQLLDNAPGKTAITDDPST